MNPNWIKNIIAIRNGELDTACPICGAKRVQYKETIVNAKTGRGYGDIWCDECKHALHLSRGVFDAPPISTTDKVPDGLKYYGLKY